MSYYEITIVDKNNHYNDCCGLVNPCYVEANSENEALEELYNYAKNYEAKNISIETENISPDMVMLTKKDHFKITGKTNDKNNFKNTHMPITNYIWTKK